MVPESAADFPRPVRGMFEAQVALARRAISPGSIDAALGSQTRAAISVFQAFQNLPTTGLLDTNTRARLMLDAPLLTTYTVTTNDLARLQPLGKTWLAKSQQTALDYETELELVAEKSHSHPELIRRLNPGVNWTNIAAGTVLQIPAVEYPASADKAAFAVIHLAGKFLEAFDATNEFACAFPMQHRGERRETAGRRTARGRGRAESELHLRPGIVSRIPEAQGNWTTN